MEKDIGKIRKNETTDIVVRLDDFGGRVGLTIREYTNSDRYTGFTKSGTRIPAEYFAEFKELINSIDESEIQAMHETAVEQAQEQASEQASEQPAEQSVDQAQQQLTDEEAKRQSKGSDEEIKEEVF